MTRKFFQISPSLLDPKVKDVKDVLHFPSLFCHFEGQKLKDVKDLATMIDIYLKNVITDCIGQLRINPNNRGYISK